MPQSTGWAVSKLCRAQELLRDAATEIGAARGDTRRLSGGVHINDDDFAGTSLERSLYREVELVLEHADGLDPMIRDLAALIPDREDTDA